MKILYSTFLFVSSLFAATILPIPLTTQQHDQWCWSGTTTSIIQYYGTQVRQCDVANFARTQINKTTAPFHNFGTTDCCVDTSTFAKSQAPGSCNYWNYNWGNPGSIQDILNNWSVTNGTLGGTYTFAEVQTQINAGHPFIIRYGWTAGGGHFIVGRGFDANTQNVYLMNPWPGDGYQIVQYNTVVSASDHTWTHTNTISKAPPSSSILASSSSNATSSAKTSSSVAKSSPSILAIQKNTENSIQFVSASQNELTWNGLAGNAQIQVLSADGQVLQTQQTQTQQGLNHLRWHKPLALGYQLIQIQSEGQKLRLWVQIQD